MVLPRHHYREKSYLQNGDSETKLGCLQSRHDRQNNESEEQREVRICHSRNHLASELPEESLARLYTDLENV